MERHRIHRAPQPRSKTAALFPPRRRAHLRSASLPVNNGHAYASSPLAPAALTIEELALLPLCGVSAHRAIRTFSDVLAPPVNRKPSDDQRPDVRALVLRGHDGAGALAVQMLGKRGVRICVQVPESAMLDEADTVTQRPRKLSLDVVRPSMGRAEKGKGKEQQQDAAATVATNGEGTA